LDDGWKETRKFHELFVKKSKGDAQERQQTEWARQLGKTSRMEEMGGREIVDIAKTVRNGRGELIRRCIKTQNLEKGNSWLNKVKQELETLGVGNKGRSGEDNNRMC
jgi:hypothetical protein